MATNGMTINGLNPLSALTADDKIPVWDTGASGEPTKEITAQNMANSVKSLASLPNTTEMNTAIEQSTADVIRTGDVVNDLTSTETQKPLSAAQGKALNDDIKSRLNVYENIVATQRAWPGDTIKFNGIYANRIHRFTAVSTGRTWVDTLLCTREGSIYEQKDTQAQITAVLSNGELTITLPQSSYWYYSLEIIGAY